MPRTPRHRPGTICRRRPGDRCANVGRRGPSRSCRASGQTAVKPEWRAVVHVLLLRVVEKGGDAVRERLAPGCVSVEVAGRSALDDLDILDTHRTRRPVGIERRRF